MSGHTPAPWKAENGIIYDPDGHALASVVDEDGDYIGPCGEADARLIEAAPKLLKKLQEVSQALWMTQIIMLDAESRKACREIVEDARALIAQVTS